MRSRLTGQLTLLGAMALGLPGLRAAPAAEPPMPLTVGDTAPRFILKSPDGTQDTGFGQYRGECPLILLFGSYTWAPFVAHVGDMQQMYTDYKDLAAFRIVYINEAHAADGDGATPYAVDKGILEHRTYDQRCAVARRMCEEQKVDILCLVDGMDNAANEAYQAYPGRVYLIRKDGRLGVVGDPGPTGFKPGLDNVRAWLAEYRRIGSEPPLDFDPRPATSQPSGPSTATQPAATAALQLAALVGEWNMVTDLGGEHIEAIMELKMEKGQLLGVWKSRGGEMPLHDIQLEGPTLTFRRVLATRRLDFEGTFDGQTITGAYKTRLGTLPCSGKKSTPPTPPSKQQPTTSQPAGDAK